ncbi:MAG: hypothetical protein IJN25_08675 [Clostridia bacterium]|nr:hypothetical protein [Clostridia bacterium]
MEQLAKIITALAWPAAFVIASAVLRKPMMKLKKISVEKIEIETREDEHTV